MAKNKASKAEVQATKLNKMPGADNLNAESAAEIAPGTSQVGAQQGKTNKQQR